MEVKKTKEALLDLYRMACNIPKGSFADARESFACMRISSPLVDNLELESTIIPAEHILEDDYHEKNINDIFDHVLMGMGKSYENNTRSSRRN